MLFVINILFGWLVCKKGDSEGYCFRRFLAGNNTITEFLCDIAIFFIYPIDIRLGRVVAAYSVCSTASVCFLLVKVQEPTISAAAKKNMKGNRVIISLRIQLYDS